MSGSVSLSAAPLSPFPIIQALVRQIQRAAESNLTGSLNFDTVHVPRMRLYFVMGRLVWASGGLHRLRRWRRLLNQYCPATTSKLQALQVTHEGTQSEYDILRHLVSSHQISREVARQIIHANIVEVLFDVVQASKLIEKFSYTKLGFLAPNETITLLSFEELIHDLESQWSAWCDVNLAPYSPNLSPALVQSETLRSQVTEQTYSRLEKMLKGYHSMRELSMMIQWDLGRFGQSMIAYEQQGIVQLLVTPDLSLSLAQPEQPAAGTRSTTGSPPSHRPAQHSAHGSVQHSAHSSAHGSAHGSAQGLPANPLIMCIDDSASICQKMGQFIQGGGYRYVSVQDPIRALPIMLEQKPDLVFVDLVMPVIGGYELCAQIRRIPAFKETPLIILSSNVFDRIRGRLAGVNDALGKTTPPEQILAAIARWLPAGLSLDEPTD